MWMGFLSSLCFPLHHVTRGISGRHFNIIVYVHIHTPRGVAHGGIQDADTRGAAPDSSLSPSLKSPGTGG